MKLWVDDVRPAPYGYKHIKSVHDAMYAILWTESAYWENETIELIDLDHDAGDYANDGGDYIKLLDWLEETGRDYPIRLHSMNHVGVANMRAIIERNGWTEIK